MDNKVVYLFGSKDKTEQNFEKNAAVSSDVPEEKVREPIPIETRKEMPEPDITKENAMLYQLAKQKEDGKTNATWSDIAAIMNAMFCQNSKPKDVTTWRKRYLKLREEYDGIEIPEPEPVVPQEDLTAFFRDMAKKQQNLRDERLAYTRQIRSESRQDQVLDLLKQEIKALPPFVQERKISEKESDRGIYAMLSDIHYGIEFESFHNRYNSEIAKARVLRYADEIILAGKRAKAVTCFVSLMGDMISGNNHMAIRIENKENVIKQVIGVSDLVAMFLHYLSAHFTHVYVNSVDGNHSRIDPNLENVLRDERLDSLIPWYCKARLANHENVIFVENDIDPTVGSFRIVDKLYVSVHGDLERDLKITAANLEKLIGSHIDYILAGHTHVAEVRTEDTTYIRNGCVCGSGDDYTMKKRLFSPPCQVFMVLDHTGAVESVHTVNLISTQAVDELECKAE